MSTLFASHPSPAILDLGPTMPALGTSSLATLDLEPIPSTRRTQTIGAVARRSSGWAAAAAALLLPFAIARAATSAPPGGTPAPVPSAPLLREAETAYAEIRRISNLVGSDAALDELSGRISRVEGEFADLRSAGPSAAMAD